MNLNDLTIRSENLDTERLTQNWRWLLPAGLEFLMITRCADAFLLDSGSGRVLFLDAQDGELELIADDFSQFKALLGDPDFVTDYFSLGLLAPALDDPMPEGAVFALATPPVLGGSPETDPLELVDIYEYFDRMGTLWQQLSQIDIEPDSDADPGSDTAEPT